MEDHPLSGWRNTLEPVIQSKIEEFHLLGYDRISDDELWECMLNKVWKKKQKVKDKMLHQLVEDVLGLSINDYMNYLAMEARKGNLVYQFEPIEK